MEILARHTPTPPNRRRQARRRVYFGAIGYIAPTEASFDCSIRNISETGAQLRLSDQILIPARFHLIHLRAGCAFEVEVVGISKLDCGVKLVRKIDFSEGEPLSLHLRALWLARHAGS